MFVLFGLKGEMADSSLYFSLWKRSINYRYFPAQQGTMRLVRRVAADEMVLRTVQAIHPGAVSVTHGRMTVAAFRF
jgi:hypothetical protein